MTPAGRGHPDSNICLRELRGPVNQMVGATGFEAVNGLVDRRVTMLGARGPANGNTRKLRCDSSEISEV
jgi:hypothetical protein